jgi:AraC-like DNA-binding protein
VTWIDIALRVAVVSQLVFVGILILRAGWPLSAARGLALALSGGVAAYMYCSAPPPHALTALNAPLLASCVANPAIFWLFACAVFDDAFRPRLWHAVASIALVTLGLWSYAARGADAGLTHELLTVVQRLLSLAFLLGGLWIVFRGKSADLLENRRRLRDWLTAMIGGYMLVVVAVEISLFDRQPPALLSTLNIALILVIVHLVSHALAKVKPSLLDANNRSDGTNNTLPESQRAVLERLRREIEEKRCYRQEGLSIAALADRIGTQEYVLRRVINQGLGFRNFNEFLHSYRIRDACERLRQTSGPKPPVLTIALEVGYGSVGPFNRAFKEMVGMTPTAYRQQQTSAKSGDDP